MCGLAGFVDFRKRTSSQDLVRMVSCLQHRGPDGEGIFFAETPTASVGLGHKRLSIIDLSKAADQPMHFDGLNIVFNGEIYNYLEIRKELEELGHKFLTHSDTEVILHSWRQWGQNSIDRWIGMFAITFYDAKNDKLILIRDRSGVKPLFYYWKDNLLLFGSELKSLVSHYNFPKEIDVSALASFLQFGYVSHPHCIYRDTHKVSPGHFLEFDLTSQRSTSHQYWNVYDYYNKPKLNIDFNQAVEETEKILSKAFQYRMVADVPVGIFLSGGYDSACVAALLQCNRTEKLKTFTIGMTDKRLDEAPYAKKVAAHLGTEHTEYYCSWKEALDIIPQLPYFYDEPFADSSAIPTLLVSKLARQSVTVALSADAGDEIFAGYNRYGYLLQYAKKLGTIPTFGRRLLATMMETVSSDRIPLLRNLANFHSRYNKIKNLLIDPSPQEGLRVLSEVFTQRQLKKLLNASSFSEVQTAHTSKELKNEFHDSLSALLAIDYQTYLVDDILQKVDRATMSVSLEGREPFLDQNIIEWAAQLTSEYKLYNGQKKYILKEVVHRHLPRKIMERPKMGFAIPVQDWLSNELKYLIEDYLSEEALKAHLLFNISEVKTLVNDFLNGHKEKYVQIWHLLMFQMWYKRWMQN
jgi:asparagine synthase (glutamine-hydrolysing)